MTTPCRRRYPAVRSPPRRRWRLLEVSPEHATALHEPSPDIYQRNIEYFIGTVKVPVGLAGPLRVNGLFASGDYYVPLATTEAAPEKAHHRHPTVTCLCVAGSDHANDNRSVKTMESLAYHPSAVRRNAVPLFAHIGTPVDFENGGTKPGSPFPRFALERWGNAGRR